MKLRSLVSFGTCFGFIGVAGVIGASGCTSTLTIGPGDDSGVGPITEDDSGSSGFEASAPDTGSPATSTCNSCLYGQCVGTYSNCIQNSGCLAAYQCAVSPACANDSSGACVQSCFDNAGALAQSLYLALADCDFFAECSDPAAPSNPPCAATCAPSPDYCANIPSTVGDGGSSEDAATPADASFDDATLPPDDAGAPDASSPVDAAPALTCDQCQQANCSAQLAACAVGTPCGLYNQCLLACQDQACDTACQTQDAAGYQAATALGTCTTSSCPQCQ